MTDQDEMRVMVDSAKSNFRVLWVGYWTLVHLGMGLIAGLTLLSGAVAHAGSVAGALPVQIQITSSCAIGASALTFATASGTSLVSTPISQTGSISVDCTNSSPYSIGLDNGLNASALQRRLANGSNYIPYDLYLDAAHTQPWTTAATNSTCTSVNACYLGTGNGASQSINVYGVIPTVASAPVGGTYNDSVTITVIY